MWMSSILVFVSTIFYEKTSLNRDTEWFGRSLEPYWSDRPLKTTCRRVRGYWTTNRCCLVKYLLPQNSVEREIESQTGRKQWTFYLVPWVLFQKKKSPSRSSQCGEFSTRVIFLAYGFVRSKSLVEDGPKTAVKIGTIHLKGYYSGFSNHLRH